MRQGTVLVRRADTDTSWTRAVGHHECQWPVRIPHVRPVAACTFRDDARIPCADSGALDDLWRRHGEADRRDSSCVGSGPASGLENGGDNGREQYVVGVDGEVCDVGLIEDLVKLTGAFQVPGQGLGVIVCFMAEPEPTVHGRKVRRQAAHRERHADGGLVAVAVGWSRGSRDSRCCWSPSPRSCRLRADTAAVTRRRTDPADGTIKSRVPSYEFWAAHPPYAAVPGGAVRVRVQMGKPRRRVAPSERDPAGARSHSGRVLLASAGNLVASAGREHAAVMASVLHLPPSGRQRTPVGHHGGRPAGGRKETELARLPSNSLRSSRTSTAVWAQSPSEGTAGTALVIMLSRSMRTERDRACPNIITHPFRHRTTGLPGRFPAGGRFEPLPLLPG